MAACAIGAQERTDSFREFPFHIRIDGRSGIHGRAGETTRYQQRRQKDAECHGEFED
jgi:hypothetical protein